MEFQSLLNDSKLFKRNYVYSKLMLNWTKVLSINTQDFYFLNLFCTVLTKIT
jgi:hypothetical protein